jgi:oligopeptide/dipeptide ABC transporter ATP-binding protein
MMATTVLEARGLSVHFPTGQGPLRAVDEVSFALKEGQTTCLVGESGCGKSMVALSLVRLVPPPGEIVEGRILFDSRDLLQMEEQELRGLRGNAISVIFQEPMTALNPVYPVGPQVAEVIRHHHGLTRRGAADKAREIMATVGLPATEQFLDYPHQLSGGMRQRVLIATALACHPSVLIADEPTTALDVTIQAQILDLLARLQTDMGMTVLFITHDLSVVAEIADDVMVMYAGQLVEQATVAQVFEEPAHPYTQALLRAVPRPPRLPGQRLPTIAGQVPQPRQAPSGCLFADRCPSAFARCRLEVPDVRQVSPDHRARCFLVKP